MSKYIYEFDENPGRKLGLKVAELATKITIDGAVVKNRYSYDRDDFISANDLMLGDYVMIDGEVKKVRSIESDGGINRFSRYGEELAYYNPSGIRITHHLLKELGFVDEYVGAQHNYAYHNSETGDHFGLFQPIDCDYFKVGSFNIKYIHELQHLLKLSGCSLEIKI